MFEGAAGGDLSVRQRLSEAATLLAPIVSGPVWRLSEDDLEAAVEQSFAVESVIAAARAVLVAAADDRSLRSRTGAPTTQRWLTQRLRLSRSRAEAVLREANAVVSEPVVLAALAGGRCAPEQAAVITKVATALPPVAAEVRERAVGLLVEQCTALEPAALARAGQHLLETLVRDPDTDDPDEQARVEAQAQEQADAVHARRSLTWRRQVDGSVSGRFRLDPLGGQTLLTALSALTARRDRDPVAARADRTSAGGDDADPAELAGLVQPLTADIRSIAQRRADALVTLASSMLGAGQVPARGGIRPTLTVTTSLEMLEGRVAAAGALPYGGRLDPTSLRRLACDASIIPAVLDGVGQVLDLGRARRLFTPAQRRALALRDQGCVHPGCTAPPSECEAHHLNPWYLGGRSDLTNGALLCDADHDRHHREGWTIHLDHRGLPDVIPPASLDPARRPRQHIRFQTQRLRT